MTTLNEAVDDAITASATFAVLVDEFNAQLNRKTPSSLTQYRQDVMSASIPLVDAAALLADAVVTAVQLLEDRVTTLETHDHDGVYAPTDHGHD